MKAKRRAAGVAKVLAGAVLLVVALFPIYWLVAMSIRETGEMQGQIPLLPQSLTFEHFANLFLNEGFGQATLNSLQTTLSSLVLSLIVGVCAAYVIARSMEEAEAALRDMLLDDKFGHGRVIVEDYLEGPEFSFMCFVSGSDVWPMPLAQDHKRAYDGDRGPNTGGMGAYSPVPFISEDERRFALDNIMKKTAAAMVLEGLPFTGVLYGGLMKTRDGIKVIEFNARFGDPETEVVLPRLKSDIYDIFAGVADGSPVEEPVWDDRATLGIVLASKGYPGSCEKGFPIGGLDALNDPDIRVYHMGTAWSGDGLVTAGGRVLIVVGRGDTLAEARLKAIQGVGRVACDNLFYRTDIGAAALEH